MKKRKNLTFQEFYAASELLKNSREEVLATCHTWPEVAAFINGKLGLEATTPNAETVCRTIGIELTNQPHRKATGINAAAIKTLETALYRLYRKLGEEIPAELEALHKQYVGEPSSNGPVALPIPVKSVPRTETIPIVNRINK